MDKTTLKSIIIGYKINGLSFAEISNKLRDEYNVNMSRQAVCGLYNRATADDAVEANKELVVKSADICKYASLGLNSKSIKTLVDSDKLKISVNKIDDILIKSVDHLGNIEEDMVNIAYSGFVADKTMHDIIESLEFKGVKPTSKKLDYIMNKVVTRVVNEKCAEVLAHTFSTTGDRDLVRSTISKFNLDITFKDIGKVLNEKTSM